MSARIFHSISQIDEVRGNGLCAVCGPVGIYKKPNKQHRLGYYWECREKRKSDKRLQMLRRRENILAAHCVTCGFVPEDMCQLNIDHVIPRWRGGPDDESNYQTLCANCHALKSRRDFADYNAFRYGT